MRQAVQIVWLKRDLRLRDHAPLAAAAEGSAPVLLLYCFEPELVANPHYSERHWRFIYESLVDLNRQLEPLGGQVLICHHTVVPTLQWLHRHFRIQALFSHQETGMKVTFDRDRAVRAFCRERHISWREFPQDGVIRGRKHRDGFRASVNAFLQRPPISVPLSQLRFAPLPDEAFPGVPIPDKWKTYQPPFQPGGERKAWQYLDSFLRERGRSYTRQLSKPAPSRYSCSRISPYLAYGNISLRELWQWSFRSAGGQQLATELERFRERTWWRTHYLQKLEAEWQIEFEPINRNLHRLNRQVDPEFFRAWMEGHTGFPMVDASMRCLQATGWLNFRMRAMLVTFASYALWQPFRPIAEVLARLFLDFEPGIHFPQIQMQAGLTGYHPLRIFSPIIQGEQHDADGAFVHRWVPELRAVPPPYCHYPWRLTPLERGLYRIELGRDYPAPIVDYETVIRAAKERYWAVRQEPATRALLPAIWRTHCMAENEAEYRKELARTAMPD